MEDTNVDCDGPEVSKQHENATNYFQLVQLTMIEGTNVVRKNIIPRIPQGKTLHTNLADRRSEFTQRGSGFNRQQLDILYPVSGNADLAKIDMALWFALARKFKALPMTYREGLCTKGAGNTNETTPLLGTEEQWCQDMATIQVVRNDLFHLAKPEIETEIFNLQWNRLTEALRRLDPDLDPSVIERYRMAELNPSKVTELRAMITEQCLRERCEDLAGDVKKKKFVNYLLIGLLVVFLIVITAACFVYFFKYRHQRTCEQSQEYRVIGNLAGLKFQPREGWGAKKPRANLEPLHLPVPNIIYTHTAEISQCSVPEECCKQVENIQYLHMNDRKPDKFDDIGFHYLIDSKGIVYEGRSISNKPAAVKDWNHNITSVAFIGNFMYQIPTVEALGTFDLLIAYLRYNNYITKNYTIYGMCECRDTDSPGRILYDEINRSILKHIFGHVRHRPENKCFFNDSLVDDCGGNQEL